jgi:hypothetical protein
LLEKTYSNDIGIVVGVGPTSVSELKIAACRAGKERSQLERAKRSADSAPLFLQRSAHDAGLFFGGCF